MAPAALTACGNRLPGARIRFRLAIRHMSVASEIDENVMRTLLKDLDRRGYLMEHTLDVAAS